MAFWNVVQSNSRRTCFDQKSDRLDVILRHVIDGSPMRRFQPTVIVVVQMSLRCIEPHRGTSVRATQVER